MKRKYYMRGLGIGIAITTVLFTVVFSSKQAKLTDEQIIARAQELGYVKGDTGKTEEQLSNLKNQTPVPTQKTQAETVTPGAVEHTELSPIPTEETQPTENTENNTEQSQKGEDNDPEVTPPAAPTGPLSPEQGKMYELVIKKGVTSEVLGKDLEKAGVLAEGMGYEFDQYLKAKKLDSKIKTGKYEIPYGATFDEIAGIIIK